MKKCDNKKKQLKKRTIFTIVSMINLVWYTIVVLIANFHDHSVQAELTVAWFSAWTVELALLFGIKIKSKNDTSEDDSEESSSETDASTDPMYSNIQTDKADSDEGVG